MTIKITTPNSGSDALTFGSATTATVAEVTGTEVSSGEGKLELKTTTGGTSAAKVTVAANGTVTLATPLPVASGGTGNVGNNHVAWVHSQTGVGSTNTRIPIWGSTQEATGDAITFASSAAAGSSFTITEAGLYEVFLGLYNGGGNTYYGASLNSNQLTTDITGINVAHRIFVTYAATNTTEACSRIIRCAVDDVIRPHQDSVNGANSALHSFCVRKIGNI